MKTLNSFVRVSGIPASRLVRQSFLFSPFNLLIQSVSVFVVLVLLAGCSKDVSQDDSLASNARNANVERMKNIVKMYTGMPSETMDQLQEARSASAKYQNIENAFRDGYADISVVVPNMGYHFLSGTNLDGNFDHKKPEILVYNKMDNGKFELVAVEYAVPIELSPNSAPSGFYGNHDVWDKNTGFGLWLLHAWVWEYNPAGVFNPTNANVHLH